MDLARMHLNMYLGCAVKDHFTELQYGPEDGGRLIGRSASETVEFIPPPPSFVPNLIHKLAWLAGIDVSSSLGSGSFRFTNSNEPFPSHWGGDRPITVHFKITNERFHLLLSYPDNPVAPVPIDSYSDQIRTFY